MNKEQKAAVVDDVAAQIEGAEAVLAVDYRGISVPQAAELRQKLNDAGARFRVVKNTLTIRAAEKAGADDLKELLEGPTAFTFVAAEGGDVAMAAKALSQFRREHEILDFKGGRMNGEPLTVEQLQALARLPARDVLSGQLVGVLASPVTGLVRGLNQLIAGLAMQLGQIAEQGLVGGEAPAAEDKPQEAEQGAEEDAAESEAEESAGEESGEEPSTETDTPDQGDETDTPSEGEEEKEG
ncbi:MAG TPA: 50S ribosomal protein L10 [Thermoleophilaceae bacterium]|nr:50S ribosomal protein L10 [Thermoleophilaceae bacterium]